MYPVVTSFDFSKQLTWLIRLRWFAVAGQLLMLAVADKVLFLPLPVLPIWGLILVVFLSNVALQFHRFFLKRISRIVIGATLVLDTLILTGLLYLTGGPDNPFSIVYLLHVSIAALLLGGFGAWIMVGLSTICFSLLFIFPCQTTLTTTEPHCSLSSISPHLYGMFLAFSLVAILTGYFLTKMSEALKNQEREISDLRLLAAHEERLTSLTTLAGGAAHELSTPLSTIYLAASELKKSLLRSNGSPATFEDIELILSQIERCKTIIENMAGQSGEAVGEMNTTFSAETLKNELINYLSPSLRSRVVIEFENLSAINAPMKALTQALGALIKNGIDASDNSRAVQVHIHQKDSWISFTIKDFGAGIPSEVLTRIGEPFFTTKETGKGMGLGIFLVKLFALRLGGTFNIVSEVGKGTQVTLQLPRTL
jgi:two-component system sensor histidine kinase RegB